MDASQTLADHLVAVAARLIGEQGTSRLTVHTIASEAGVADGVLYNYFANKEELIALGLHAHVTAVFDELGGLPIPGTGTLETNLRELVMKGLLALGRILPAFAGVMGNTHVMNRMDELLKEGHQHRGLPTMLAGYLDEEQKLGRVAPNADTKAATTLIIGACHDVALPPLLRGLPLAPINVPTGFVDGLVAVVLHGIAAPAPRPPRSRPASGRRTHHGEDG